MPHCIFQRARPVAPAPAVFTLVHASVWWPRCRLRRRVPTATCTGNRRAEGHARCSFVPSGPCPFRPVGPFYRPAGLSLNRPLGASFSRVRVRCPGQGPDPYIPGRGPHTIRVGPRAMLVGAPLLAGPPSCTRRLRAGRRGCPTRRARRHGGGLCRPAAFAPLTVFINAGPAWQDCCGGRGHLGVCRASRSNSVRQTLLFYPI